MKKKYKNKILLISLFIVIFIAIIIISSIKVYSIYSYKNTNKTAKTNETNINKSTKKSTKKSLDEMVIKLAEKPTENTEKQETETDTENEQTPEQQEQQAPQAYTYTASNGKTYDMIGTIKIPSLNIEYPILANYSEDLLKVSVVKYWGGTPNEVGNLCILGHNYKNSKFFGNLPNIQKDAIIQITDLKGRTLEYKVYETAIVSPEDMSCTTQLTNGHTEVTLITCYYETPTGKATKRFVAKARAN